MRISAIQRDALYTLLALEKKGHKDVIPSTSLLKIINSTRDDDIFSSSFRLSMATLAKNGMVYRLRDRNTFRLAYRLTDEGRARAAEIAAKVDEAQGEDG